MVNLGESEVTANPPAPPGEVGFVLEGETVTEKSGPPPRLRASSPFDRSDADIIFRTSDGFDFGLHTQVLIMSSLLLAKMVQDADRPGKEQEGGLLRVVDVQETSKVLDSLFRYCYPVLEPKPTKLEDIRDVLCSATHYDISAAIGPLSENLVTFIRTDPVRVYAIAVQNNLYEIGHESAEEVAKGNFLEKSCPELQMIPADSFWNLMVYCEESRLAVSGTAKLLWRDVRLQDDTRRLPDSLPLRHQQREDSDITIQSADGTRFQLHKLILSTASPVFQVMFTLPRKDVGSSEPYTIPVTESAQVWEYLVRLIYPTGEPPKPPDRIPLIYELLGAAIKYEMERVLSFAKVALSSCIATAPISVFLISCRYGFSEIAIMAARHAIRAPLCQLVSHPHSQMEVIDQRIDASAHILHRLIRYRSTYVDAIENLTWATVVKGDKWKLMKRVMEKACQKSVCDFREFESEGKKWPVPNWLGDFATKTKTALMNGVELREEDLDEFVDRAVKCSGCADKALAALRAYRRMLLEHVDSNVAKISIETSRY